MTPPHRLRILMTCDAVGGVWVYATSLARALASRGHRVHLVTLGPEPAADQREALRDADGVSLQTTDLALEWIDPEGADLDRAALCLREIERRVAPDIVHLNGYREALAGWRAPCIVVAHSCVRSWWQACRSGEPDEPRWSAYVANVAAGLTNAGAWVAPTASFAATIDSLYAPARAGQVILNGGEPPARSSAKKPIVLAAGRLWDEAKNVGALAAASAQIDWPVLIAGDAGAAAPSTHDNVCWLGTLPRPALLDQMGRAAIFVSPALYEPFGLAALEAAQRGCALVLSDIPSFRELWDGAALFVDPRHAQALADAANRFIRDASLHADYARAASERAQRYTLASMVDHYETLYRETIASETLVHSGAGRDLELAL